MKGFTRFVSWFPFFGKYTIRPLLYDVYQSTTTTDRRIKYLKALVVLILIILLHGAIATVGFVFAGRGNVAFWAKIYMAGFGLVNTCVTLTQLYLAWRMTTFVMTAERFPHRQRAAPEYSVHEKSVMLAVTFVGVAIFVLIIARYA